MRYLLLGIFFTNNFFCAEKQILKLPTRTPTPPSDYFIIEEGDEPENDELPCMSLWRFLIPYSKESKKSPEDKLLAKK